MNKKYCVIILLTAVFALLAAPSCNEQNESPENELPETNLQFLTAELGGCNLKSALKDDDSESNDDVVVITVDDESVNIFVGLNYICKAEPFETKVEIIDDVIHIYIVDACDVLSDCYMRCICYYKFDFVFQGQPSENQEYKILLFDPRIDEHIILSEGIMVEKTEYLTTEPSTNSLAGRYSGSFNVEYFEGMREDWTDSGTVTLELKNGKYVYDSDIPPTSSSGNYSITNDKIVFKKEPVIVPPGLYLAPPDFDTNLWLNGEYDFTFDDKMLKFSATKYGNGVGHYQYDLEKMN